MSRIVTIDLDNKAQVAGLTRRLRYVALVEALEELLPQPKAKEPLGFGAVVRDQGFYYTRADVDEIPWKVEPAGHGNKVTFPWYCWEDFTDNVEVISIGYHNGAWGKDES